MRSIKLFVASMAMVVSMSVGGFTGKGYAQNVTETESVQDVSSQWVNSDQEYQYPISTEDEEWKSMTYEEQLISCQMPDAYLDVISTEELLELALDYPFNLDFMMYDDYYKGLQHLEKSSNIFAELLSRDDASSKIADAYILLETDYVLLTSEAVGNTLNASEYDEEILLSVLLTYDKVSQNLTSEEITRVKAAVVEKNNQKNGFCEDYATAGIMDKFGMSEVVLATKSVTEAGNSIVDTMAAEGFVADGGTTSKTNGGVYFTGRYTKYDRTVDCEKYKSGEFTDEEVVYWKQYMSETHPSWVFISNATKKYNCHSYCWINKSSSNTYWLENPNFYAASASYFFSRGTDIAIAYANSYIIINNEDGPAHSVRTLNNASGISSGDNRTSWMKTTMCDSKVGSLGVYRASLYDMYHLYDGIYYRVYTAR